MQVRKSNDRGSVNLGWLDSKHTFSFGSYYDKNHMGFGPLVVINEDRVSPSGGFATHGHENMEIISYVIEGQLEHKDSIGTGSVIVPGELQRMSAGSGIRHSEYNPSNSEETHFLQIWIKPAIKNIEPSYEQKKFFDRNEQDFLKLIGSSNGRDNSLSIHQDVEIYVARLQANRRELKTNHERLYWVQVVKGNVLINDTRALSGDGLAFDNIDKLIFETSAKAEILIFDMTADS